MTGKDPGLWTRVLCARAALRVALACLLLAAPSLVKADDGAAHDWLPLTALCQVSTALPAPARDHDLPAGFSCSGAPDDYQQGSLWLLGSAQTVAGRGTAPVLMVHSSRFDRLLVGFRYADGLIAWQDVHSGNFAGHWRLGGQIGFAAPARDARLTGIVLRFDRLASAEVLRIRLVHADVAELQSIALATMIGAALMMLVFGAVYNVTLGVTLGLTVRRSFPILQGIWSGTMALWGAIWSQLFLFAVPGMAGTLSSQVGTILACAMLMLTALSLFSAIEPGDTPRWLRRLGLGLAWLVGVLGVPLGLMRSGAIELLADIEGMLVVVMVAVIIACLGMALRRGSAAARAFAGAWLVPLLVMGLSGLFDLGDVLWGGGPQMLVLLAAAWQTVWLSLAATRRITHLRQERDQAVAAEAIAHELARRDPLTGLSNRRGFIERIAPLIAACTGDDDHAVALLLLDLDRFKAINDSHGHDAGDDVLIAIARRLERWDCALQVVGRMGGEEFAILVSGMGRFAAHSFAESVRQAIAACDHGLPAVSVTVSIGAVMAGPGDTFATLYRAADTALYAAKHQGRDRVVMAHATLAAPDQPPMAELG